MPHPVVPLPRRIEIVPDFNAIVIRRRWFSPAAYFLIFFSLFWNGFMAIWMGIALEQGISLMALFGSLHAAVGIGLIYYTVALFVNHTDVRVGLRALEVRHAPMPWPGNVSIPVEEISQLYCKERIQRGKNGTTVTYEVHVVDRNQRQRKLLRGLPEAEQAYYIEAEIERTLGLEDVAVTGELPK